MRSRPNGLPIATTGSPTSTASELPSGSGVSALADVVHPQHGEVGGRIGADDLGLDRVAVREAHSDLVGALDDVVVRDDVPGLVDDEAGAERRCLLRSEPRSRRSSCSSS